MKISLSVTGILLAVALAAWNLSAEEAPEQSPKAADPSASNEKPSFRDRPKAIPSQSDRDWVDNRWQQTDTGPTFAGMINLPGGPTLKGLAVRVGDKEQAAVCYDTALLRMSGGWTGDYLKLDPARFGLIRKPRAAGTLRFKTPAVAGWSNSEGAFPKTPPEAVHTNLPDDWARFEGHTLHGNRVVLHYRVGEVRVLESPWFEERAGAAAFTRTFEVGPSAKPLAVRVCESSAKTKLIGTGVEMGVDEESKATTVRIPAHDEPIAFKVLIRADEKGDAAAFEALAEASAPPRSLRELTRPGPRRWTERIVTKGRVGQGSGPYVIDTLTLPFENPYRALFFAAGHDFFSNGDIAVCTVHGDVWVVSGVDETLEELTWKRYATGLFQPLGLRIVDDKVYVIGRDQVTRLHDVNGDGEADFYECFNNDLLVTGGDHEYVTCLDTDTAGNFYFIHAKTGVMRLSDDGKQLESVATGFRNPNGMGVGPNNEITAAPQEGTWTPASNIVAVKEGGYYGFGGPKVTGDRPLGYDPPMCYMPRDFDNSSGGQVWVTSDRWGPLEGSMLHLSFGQCRILLGLREEIGDVVQGGVVRFPTEPGDFESGIMRGRFSPHDGQLYVSGLRGWQTRAVMDGCLQRVRYTGKPVHLPIAVRTLQNGIALTFSGELERDTAENPGNYAIEQWNYRWTKNYGSPDYMVSDPRRQGRDQVEVLSATLFDDGRTVFLELGDVKPVMQTAIRYTLKTPAGAPVRNEYVHTIHAVREERVPESRLTRREAPGSLPDEIEKSLRRGLHVEFQSAGKTDARPSRMAALFVGKGAAPTPFLSPGPFVADFEGYLRAPLAGEYTLRLTGRGRASLSVNGEAVLQSELTDLDRTPPARVRLHKGYNEIELTYRPAEGHHARLRLLWSGDGFAAEAVPAANLFHAPPSSTEAEVLRMGRELFATRHCAKCHKQSSGAESAMLEMQQDTPNLAETATRLNRKWLFEWLLNPPKLRSGATMPSIFDATDKAKATQQAADLVAFLVPQKASPPSTAPSKKQIEQGELLYEDLGCITCHKLMLPESDDEFGRLSLAYVAEKFRAGALAAFLREPHGNYRFSRMPDFRLNEQEASALSAYLRANVKGRFAETGVPSGDRARGSKLFTSLGCNHCHSNEADGSREAPNQAALTGNVTSHGCLGKTPGAGKAPRFGFSVAEREALAAFLTTKGESLARTSPVEESGRLVERLNCAACHRRDGRRTDRGLIIIEEGSRGLPPEVLPNLSWAGEKLWTEWTRSLLAGELEEPTRPWLKARMPQFPAYAEALSRGLAAEHGLDWRATRKTHFDPKLAALGERLSLRTGGLDCRQCHGIGELAPDGDRHTKNSPGINFALIKDRMRHDFYSRFVLDPPRFDIGVRMPKFSEDGETTKVTGILEGDVRDQFEALWHYMQGVQSRGSRVQSE